MQFECSDLCESHGEYCRAMMIYRILTLRSIRSQLQRNAERIDEGTILFVPYLIA